MAHFAMHVSVFVPKEPCLQRSGGLLRLKGGRVAQFPHAVPGGCGLSARRRGGFLCQLQLNLQRGRHTHVLLEHARS